MSKFQSQRKIVPRKQLAGRDHHQGIPVVCNLSFVVGVVIGLSISEMIHFLWNNRTYYNAFIEPDLLAFAFLEQTNASIPPPVQPTMAPPSSNQQQQQQQPHVQATMVPPSPDQQQFQKQQPANLSKAGTMTPMLKECEELFSKVRDGTVEDPNFTNASMITKPLHSRMTVTQPPFEISVHNPLFDKTRWSIMEYGKYYETGITENLQKIIVKELDDERKKETPILIDVGMNIGWFSLWGIALGAEVYAVEPNPANRLRFCESVVANKFPSNKIHLYGHAASNSAGELVLFHFPSQPGSAKLVPPEQVPPIPDILRHNVRLVQLDDIAQENGWLLESKAQLRIALLKVDVEGHDPQVLFGASRLLRSRRVENVFMEYSCTLSEKEDMRKAADLLVSSGYTIEMVGNWKGVERRGSKEKILGDDGKGMGDLSNRLYTHCRELNEKRRGAMQLNMWWKLHR